LKAIDARIYFDTNVLDSVYTLMKWDAAEEDKRSRESTHLDIEKNMASLFYVLDRGEEQWGMTFGTSQFTKEEIDKINPERDPEYYKGKVPELYLAFETLRELSSDQFEHDKRANKLSDAQEVTLKRALLRSVSDPDDVRHLLEFKNSGWEIFLTLDWEHVLSNRPALANLGLCVTSPLDVLESILPLETMIRTLHGSWAKKPEVFRPGSSRWTDEGE
jgi:hypothetical protein